MQYGIFQVAVGRWSKLPSGWVPGFIGLLTIVIAVLLVQLNRRESKLTQHECKVEGGKVLYKK